MKGGIVMSNDLNEQGLDNNGTSNVKKNGKKGNDKKKNIIKYSLISLLVLIVLGVGLFILLGSKKKKDIDPNLVMGDGQEYDPEEYKDVEMSETIDIPGFAEINFEAGKKKQYAGFQNPKNNTVHFKMSLVLKQKGKADDVIWQGDLLKPGKAFNDITLKKGLKKGKYDAVLKYECYSVKDLSKQNGSDVAIKINVM